MAELLQKWTEDYKYKGLGSLGIEWNEMEWSGLDDGYMI